MKGDRKQQTLDTAKTCKTAVYNLYNHKPAAFSHATVHHSAAEVYLCPPSETSELGQTCTILKELPVDIGMQRLILSSTSLVAAKIAGHCPNFLFHHFFHLGLVQISGRENMSKCTYNSCNNNDQIPFLPDNSFISAHLVCSLS